MNVRLLVVAVVVAVLSLPMMAAEKVLIVVSSHGAEGEGERRAGFDFGELAQVYLVLSDNGFAIDIASPKGGAATPEDLDPEASYSQRFLADEKGKAALAKTVPIEAVNANDYRAIFVIGGKGAMFDLPNDAHLQKVVARIYESGGVVGAVCHGPAALVNVRLSNGAYLVADRKVNAFTEEEENVFAEEWLAKYPFILETELRKRGAQFEESALMMVHVATDGRLVTGQNPFSAARAAEGVVRALGRAVRERQPYTDEATILLIEELLDPNRAAAARAKFNTSPKQFQARLIAMYASFLLELASDDAGVRDAVALLTLADGHFVHPKVKLTLANAYVRMGESARAKLLLQAAQREFPQAKKITEMLEQLERTDRDDSAQTPNPSGRGSN